MAPDESRPAIWRRKRDRAAAGWCDGCARRRPRSPTLSAGLAQSDPALQGISAAVAPVQDVLNRDGRRLLVPLFGSVAIVFFIACANVAGLLLTRGLQRHPEYAMRSALGAGPLAAVPPGADRKPRARDRRRGARRGARDGHRQRC